MHYFRGFLFSLIAACLLAFPAAAQDDTLSEPIPEEYTNVPSGLLLPEGSTVQQKDGAVDSGEDTNEDQAMTTDDINAAYHQGKYDVAAKHIVPLAKSGYHQAEELLGIMYHNGQGVPKDLEQAVFWLSKAAEANRPLAQHHLAIMSFLGEGIPPDAVKALMWLHIAIQHYPDGIEKRRALEDRNNVYSQLSRRDKDRALALAREWLEKKGEKMVEIPP